MKLLIMFNIFVLINVLLVEYTKTQQATFADQGIFINYVFILIFIN